MSVFGLSLLTGNPKQSGVGISHASAQEPADINSDSKVDVFDLSILLGKWATADSASDLNGNGAVDVFDLSMLLAKWGTVVSVSTAPGAHLPISYDIASLSGTKRFVSPAGNDTSGNGTQALPYATLAKAVSMAASNDSIVLRGGTYREGNVSIPLAKSLKIIAYPGETPELRGSQVFSSGWTTEGSYQYHAYTPQPVTDGSGISFTTGQNLAGDAVGKYPDQAWVNNTQLRQVSLKASLAAGTFWVDITNSRVYLMATDVAGGTVEASSKDACISIFSPNTTIEGVKITRYSNSANDYGVVKVYNTADNNLMKNVYIADTAYIAVSYMGDANINTGSAMKNVTVTTSNWMGIAAVYTDDLVLDAVDISNMNQFDEFTYAPQSGALKTSRTRYTKVINSNISNNHSQGIWFDQSNVDVEVANNQIVDNLGTGVFFEISDKLLLINNYIKATGGARPTRLAGSSGLKIINNTIIGGADSVGVFTDTRSIPGCADPAQALCTGSYSSDRDTVRSLPSTLDWMPRIDAMYNNIIAYSTNAGWCGDTTMCITVSSSGASAPIETIIHKADAARGIPQTFIDSNVYANGSKRIIHASNTAYYSVSSFTSAMAGSPVLITGIEANSRAGNALVNADGSITSSLSHSSAMAVPVDAGINQYITAGTRHYGYLNK